MGVSKDIENSESQAVGVTPMILDLGAVRKGGGCGKRVEGIVSLRMAEYR